MVDFIFAPTFEKMDELSEIPFDECMVTLSDGSYAGLEKRLAKSNRVSDFSEAQYLPFEDEELRREEEA